MNNALRYGLLFGAGALGGAVVWYFAAKDLEKTFGEGATGLQTDLRNQSRTIARQIEGDCKRVAEQAIREELALLGLTPQLIRDTTALVDRVTSYLRRLGLAEIDPARAYARAVLSGALS